MACVVLVEVDGATCSRFPVSHHCTDRLSVSVRIQIPCTPHTTVPVLLVLSHRVFAGLIATAQYERSG